MTPMRMLALSAAAAALLAGCNDDKSATPSAPVTPAEDAATDAAAVVAETGPSFASETKTFREWTAVCDNINNCAAYGPAAENSGFVMVKLDAGPDARPRVHAGSWSLPSDATRILLYIDGRNYAGKMEALESEDPVLSINNASDQLLGALANGRAMTLSAGGETAAVSLTGAAAAFLWIDERQGRIGTTTALIRKGDRPASSVPAAPTAPRLTTAAPVAQNNLPKNMPQQVSALPQIRECADVNQGGMAINEEWSVHRLGTNTLLWSIPCGAGAYNFSQAYVLSANDGTGARSITFQSSGRPQETLTNSSFDPDSNTISAFGKGRGLGDCGQMAMWAWTGEVFALKEEDMMNNCLGVHWEFWPSTWRTRS